MSTLVPSADLQKKFDFSHLSLNTSWIYLPKEQVANGHMTGTPIVPTISNQPVSCLAVLSRQSLRTDKYVILSLTHRQNDF